MRLNSGLVAEQLRESTIKSESRDFEQKTRTVVDNSFHKVVVVRCGEGVGAWVARFHCPPDLVRNQKCVRWKDFFFDEQPFEI